MAATGWSGMHPMAPPAHSAGLLLDAAGATGGAPEASPALCFGDMEAEPLSHRERLAALLNGRSGGAVGAVVAGAGGAAGATAGASVGAGRRLAVASSAAEIPWSPLLAAPVPLPATLTPPAVALPAPALLPGPALPPGAVLLPVPALLQAPVVPSASPGVSRPVGAAGDSALSCGAGPTSGSASGSTSASASASAADATACPATSSPTLPPSPSLAPCLSPLLRASVSHSSLGGGSDDSFVELHLYPGATGSGGGSGASAAAGIASDRLQGVLAHLRTLDALFVSSVTYWLSLDTTLDLLQQRNEVLETLIRPSCVALLLARLTDLHVFWRCFGYLTLRYAQARPVVYSFLSSEVPLVAAQGM
jgi:hypothetical protein